MKYGLFSLLLVFALTGSGCQNLSSSSSLPIIPVQTQSNSLLRNQVGLIKKIEIVHSDDSAYPSSFYSVLFANERGNNDFIHLNLNTTNTITRVFRDYGTPAHQEKIIDKEGTPVKEIIAGLEDLLRELDTLKADKEDQEEKLAESKDIFALYLDNLRQGRKLKFR